MLFSDSILLILRFLAVVELHCGPDTVNARLQFKAGGDRSGRTDDDAKLVQNKLVMFAERTRLHSLAPPRLHQKLRAGLGSLCFYFAFCACVHGQVMFDDSLPDRLRIATAAYEVAFSKANGAILSLADKAAVRPAPISSRNGCLWGSNYSGSSTTYRGGCNFGSGRPDSFQSEWNPALSLLTLKYNSAPVTVHRIDAEVAIVFQKDWFDMRLILRNQTGTIMQSVLFPSDLLLLASSVEAAYFPYYLPGARLLPGFFTGNRSITAIYPSARAFADYLAIDYGGGRLAWYAINTSARVAPVTLGFQDDVKTNPGSCYAVHNYSAWTPDGGRFETPVVRVQIGASPQESIRQYRNENGITDFPNLAAKLGNRSAAFASAPLVKLDLRIIGSTFAALSSRLDLIRPPAILHPVSYWPRGFDQNYPDFLPPDVRFGTADDFRSFVDTARERGLLVMPYTNPTWWDDQSPTVQKAGDVAALAVLNQNGNPVYENYGTNRGFVVSPSSRDVQDRIRALMVQWRDEVPVDAVLQDQIGSRSWLRDFNPAASDPMSYADRWLESVRSYSSQSLMTEDGWDRLAQFEIGFSGSLLTGTTSWDPTNVRWGTSSRGNSAFGPGLWEPYPLGVWLFHDKVLFYHHDLDNFPMNGGVELLTWNAAFGVMAGYHWPEWRAVNPEWVRIAAAFQPAVMARSAGKMLTSFRSLAVGVTESRFGNLAVIANWNTGDAYRVSDYSIAPSGCLALTDDGALIAGTFVDMFAGAPLSPGVHYLIVERTPVRSITVRQPSGSDTSVVVKLPEDWTHGASVQAIDRNDALIADVTTSVAGMQTTFPCARTVSGTPVEYYRISQAKPTRRRE